MIGPLDPEVLGELVHGLAKSFQLSLHIASGLGLRGNESYPDLFQPFCGFPDSVRIEDGHATLTEAPGIGFEEKSDLIAVLRTI